MNEASKQAISWADIYHHRPRTVPKLAAEPPSILPLQFEQFRAQSCVALRLSAGRLLVLGPAGGVACSSRGVQAFRVDIFTPSARLGDGSAAAAGSDSGGWERCSQIPTPRLNFAAAVVSLLGPSEGGGASAGMREAVVVVGGLDGDRQTLATAEIFDVASNCWEKADATERMEPAVEQDGDSDEGGASAEDSGSEDEGGWMWRRRMVTPRWGCAAVLTRGGTRLDVLGGSDADGAVLSCTESFDLRRRRFLHPPAHAAGSTAAAEPQAAAQAPVEGCLPPMRSARSVFAAVSLGRCLVAMGGQAPHHPSLGTAELLDFAAAEQGWVALPPMTSIRCRLAGAALHTRPHAKARRDGATLESWLPVRGAGSCAVRAVTRQVAGAAAARRRRRQRGDGGGGAGGADLAAAAAAAMQ